MDAARTIGYLNTCSAKLIVQVRDPRDHAASCKRLGRLYSAYHGSVPRAAKMWRADQEAAILLEQRYGPTTVRLHRYEDLVTDPTHTLRSIIEFVGVEWNDSMLAYYRQEAQRKAEADWYLPNMWANLDRPVMAKRIGRWVTALSTTEIASVERAVGTVMVDLGYSPSALRPPFGNIREKIFTTAQAARFLVVTMALSFAWLVRSRGHLAPWRVAAGRSVRTHHPYEHFRDRHAYRL